MRTPLNHVQKVFNQVPLSPRSPLVDVVATRVCNAILVQAVLLYRLPITIQLIGHRHIARRNQGINRRCAYSLITRSIHLNFTLSKKSQSKRYIFSGSTNDKAMNTIIEQLETSMETYTDIQAQEALDLARASMRVLHAEEVYSIERLGEGRVQMRALENKVAEVKNRVRIADLQMVFLRQKLLSHGFVLSDHVEQDFVERLRRKPLVHSQLTEPELARISTPPANLDNPPTTATDLLLQEPFARPNISRWAHATLPGEPGVIITDNVDSNTSERDAESGEELESREPNVGPSGDIGGTL